MARIKAPPKSTYEAHWDFRFEERDELAAELMTRPTRSVHEEGVLWIEYFEERRYQVLEPILLRILKPGSTALDVGCGDSLIAMVAQANDLDIHLTGIDISEGLLEHNSERWPQHEWVQGDAMDPAPGRTFDLVHAGEIIEHLDDRPPALDHWCECVAPGGSLIITTPTPTLKFPEGQHVGFESQGDIRQAMARHGIRLAESYGIGLFVPFHAKLLFRFKQVELRDAVYRWTLRATHRWPTLATQAVYVGVKKG